MVIMMVVGGHDDGDNDGDGEISMFISRICYVLVRVWKEWSIVNNTFEAMVMTDGDQCPGNLRRESKVGTQSCISEKCLRALSTHSSPIVNYTQ